MNNPLFNRIYSIFVELLECIMRIFRSTKWWWIDILRVYFTQRIETYLVTTQEANPVHSTKKRDSTITTIYHARSPEIKIHWWISRRYSTRDIDRPVSGLCQSRKYDTCQRTSILLALLKINNDRLIIQCGWISCLYEQWKL